MDGREVKICVINLKLIETFVVRCGSAQHV